MKRFLAILGAVLLLAALFAPAVFALEPQEESCEVAAVTLGGGNPGGQAGTTLSADVNAAGYWKRILEYDWTVEKSASPEPPEYLEIKQGETGTATYTVKVTRTLVRTTDEYGVSGVVTVTNGGERSTENLKIILVVQTKTGPGQFQDYVWSPVDVSGNPVLEAEETDSYPYDVSFTPVAGAQYRVEARVTITNHSGYLDKEFGPNPKADFSLPSEPTIIEIDEAAKLVSDTVVLNPAGGFGITSGFAPQTFTGSGTYSFTVSYTNQSAPYDSWYESRDTVELVECDTKAERTDSAAVLIWTGMPPEGHCRTIGYWKTHAGFTGRNADRVTQYLPIWLGVPGGAKSVQVTSAGQAVTILSTMGSNGIDKLKAQLLAAKLNIASGACGSPVSCVIEAADKFLACYGSADWATLTKKQQQQVLCWMSALDVFNNSGE